LLLVNVNVFASETDDRIESTAKQSCVFKTYFNGDDIHIQSKDGAVTLTGSASGESHKPLAWETVASLPGVKSVDNQMEVKGEVPAVNTDAWLVTKVKSALLFHRNVNASQTEVFAKNGIVTLRGKAASMAQKNLVIKYARDEEGVKAVINEMTVLAAVKKPGNKTVGEKVDTVGQSINDASISAQVKLTLLYHRSTSAVNTTAETKEGAAALGGKARNAAEKDLASKLVSDVYGVKRFVNTMIVE
jgi:hyperosmotically inducible periplasmic protein